MESEPRDASRAGGRSVLIEGHATQRIEVALALIESEGRWLVSRRAPDRVFAGLWEFPGGKVEEGESLEAAVRREVREEVGMEVEVRGRLGRVETAHAGCAVVLHVLACEPTAGEAVSGGDASVAEVRWVTLGELEQLDMPPANREILALLREGSPDTPPQ